jgi:hypothetical protein
MFSFIGDCIWVWIQAVMGGLFVTGMVYLYCLARDWIEQENNDKSCLW